MTELIVGTILLGLAVTGLAVSLQGFSMINRYQWTRQQCVAAAEAQLDSLTATGKPIGESEIERLWPKVKVAVDRAPGQGPWDGLDLVRITATGKAGSRVVAVRLARYVRKDNR